MFDAAPDEPLTVICAWCRSHVGGPRPGPANLRATHTICPPCAERVLSEAWADPKCSVTVTVGDPPLGGYVGPAVDQSQPPDDQDDAGLPPTHDLGGEG